MSSLQQNGYITIPIYSLDEIENIQKELDDIISNFQEFKPNTNQFVLGGFGALGNPSSFHNPLVRKIRSHIYPIAKEQIFKPINTDDRKLEQLICRLMIRQPKLKPSRESWHRDICPNTLETDTIFGGWVNLTKHTQYFSCIRSSHLDKPTNGKKGFATIKDKELINSYNQSPLKTKVPIPPGHLLIFNEQIIHEVLANSANHQIVRLFIGWRLTNEVVSLIPDLESKLEDQSVIPLKSFQIPPMYATLHWTNWRQKIVDFSKNIDDRCLVEREVNSGKDKGQKYIIVDRYMKSLKEYKFNLYNSYTEQEKYILRPQIIS